MSSSLTISETIVVQAPANRVWRVLLDPEEIVVCLPGAELLEIVDERTFNGQMKVKAGPVTVAYKGTIELTEVVEEEKRFEMVGKGKEKGGSGAAKMTMKGRVAEVAEGGSEIFIDADVELAGRIVRFGRGMIKGVSQQIFKQFAENLRQLVENAEPAEDEAQGAEDVVEAGDEGEASEASEAGEAGDVGDDNAGDESDGDKPEDAGGTDETDETGETSETQDEQPSAPTATGSKAIATRDAEPIRAIPLLFKVLWDSMKGFFRRLFGRGSR